MKNTAYKVEILNDSQTVFIKAHRFYKQEKTVLGYSNPFSYWSVFEYEKQGEKFKLQKRYGFKRKDDLLRHIRIFGGFEHAYKRLIEMKEND